MGASPQEKAQKNTAKNYERGLETQAEEKGKK